jgi:hypothetical protein
MSGVTFIDTSVLCELLQVPGKNQQSSVIRDELELRVSLGERFVIPITAVIETGNHIAHASGDRYAAAQRLCDLIRNVIGGDSSFLLHQFSWDGAFLDKLCSGDSTSQSLVQWAAAAEMGAGDIAILVERDRFVARSALPRHQVTIWTLEATMGAYA